MPIPQEVVMCYKQIDACSQNYVNELKEIVKIPNISSDPDAKSHVLYHIKWMSSRLKTLGFKIFLKEWRDDKSKGHVPPTIVASLGQDPRKKTILYYCHLDVLKVERSEWATDPFQLTECDGKLYGRGTAKMKGPLLCFLHAIECHHDLGIDLPINIKILCESMNECRSKGLNAVLEELKTTFLPNIDCILITDSHWLGKEYPCIVYGMRGVSYFHLIVEGARTDLCSGDFGGIIKEPMEDFLFIMKHLLNDFGELKVPNFYDDVVEVTPDEEEFYKKIKITIGEYRKNVGTSKLGHAENLKTVLMHVWRYPWFNLHFVNTSCDDSNLLGIPKKVEVRFSVRTVPNQRHDTVTKQIINYVKEIIKLAKTPNRISISAVNHMDPWYEDHLHWNYEAANKATKQVYKEEASFIREGNSFPTLLKISKALPKRNILILPIVNCEAKAHTKNENISLRCYIEGTKLLVSYFHELASTARQHDKKSSLPPKNICRDKV